MLTIPVDDFDARRSIGLHEAAEQMRGRGGHRPSVGTVRRWITQGCRLPDGSGVQLPAVKLNGELRLMLPWVLWFEEMRLRAAKNWLGPANGHSPTAGEPGMQSAPSL